MMAARTATAPPELRSDDVIRFAFPCKTTNPSNGSRGHWYAHASEVRSQRRKAWAYAKSSGTLRMATHKVPQVVRLTRAAPSNGLDDDNLRSALKAIRDGIADALGVDDRDPRVTWEYDQRRGPYSVEVEIRRRDV